MSPVQEETRVQQPFIPRVTEGSRPGGRALFALVALAGVFAFILTLFPDFLPLPFGGYADQRFGLLAVGGLLAVLPLLSVAGSRASGSAWGVLLPTVLLCLSFLALSVPFGHQPYAWAEPGMYAFFLMTMIVSGACLALTGCGVAFGHTLTAIIAATCMIYGLS